MLKLDQMIPAETIGVQAEMVPVARLEHCLLDTLRRSVADASRHSAFKGRSDPIGSDIAPCER